MLARASERAVEVAVGRLPALRPQAASPPRFERGQRRGPVASQDLFREQLPGRRPQADAPHAVPTRREHDYLNHRRDAHERHIEPVRNDCDLIVDGATDPDALAHQIW
jgi:hypothetical protein